jgi:hypothetical protein
MWRRNAAFAPLLKQYEEDLQDPYCNDVSHYGPDVDRQYRCRCAGPVPAVGRDHMKRPAPDEIRAGLSYLRIALQG